MENRKAAVKPGLGFGIGSARWIDADAEADLARFADRNDLQMADDHHDLPVYLAKSAWQLTCAQEDWPAVRFLETREQKI